MDSKLKICNAMLILGGGTPLLSLDDKSDPRVMAIDGLYDIILDSMLRGHEWNFATARKKILKDGTNPDFGYAYRYPLPTDPYCLRPVKLNNDLSAVWKVEGRFLLTDETECNLKYISRIANPAEFDACFVEALVAKGAWQLSKKTTGADESVVVNLFKVYKDCLAEAKLADWKESSGDSIQADTITGFRQ